VVGLTVHLDLLNGRLGQRQPGHGGAIAGRSPILAHARRFGALRKHAQRHNLDDINYTGFATESDLVASAKVRRKKASNREPQRKIRRRFRRVVADA